MKIAIQAADLDAKRIDGTRVYILNLLRYFGRLDSKSQFAIYHKNEFNPELTPPDFSNYEIVTKNLSTFWTQICFAWELKKNRPDVLWMPMHNVPIFRSRKIKTFVTIHDLAFKYFPQTFSFWERFKINFLTWLAVRFSDKIITISESSKKDILKFYPSISQDKIKVIYHGFDGEFFGKKVLENDAKIILQKFDLKKEEYLLYVGAIQPRKNLIVLIEAFEKSKKENPNLKLVLAGEKAWLFRETENRIEKSVYKKDIIVTGTLKFSEIKILYQNAGIFIFPSLYEGFGIPILEAFA
jgi:glycosyltransferase involved in cell wall biosynthesis